jgi:hypothetical protein
LSSSWLVLDAYTRTAHLPLLPQVAPLLATAMSERAAAADSVHGGSLPTAAAAAKSNDAVDCASRVGAQAAAAPAAQPSLAGVEHWGTRCTPNRVKADGKVRVAPAWWHTVRCTFL